MRIIVAENECKSRDGQPVQQYEKNYGMKPEDMDFQGRQALCFALALLSKTKLEVSEW